MAVDRLMAVEPRPSKVPLKLIRDDEVGFVSTEKIS
jgi:hypothetical protein